MYTQIILQTFPKEAELVGLCDNNRGRLELRNRVIVENYKGRPVPMYLDTEFDRMIREQKPDVVIVTTRDCFHDKYIVRAMELGCDVITEKLGLKGHAERCLTCRCQKQCKFYLDLKKKGGLKEMYLDCERYDGYFRDRCVFGKTMDIEDTMNLVVRYNTGAFMSYSLNAFMPWEGYQVAFNGTRGRLEHDCVESVYISGDGRVQGETIPNGTKIRLYPHFKPARNIAVAVAKGGHGGGDYPLLADIFSSHPPRDPYMRSADVAGGAMSILTGVAANKSMRTGRPVRIDSLVKRIPPVRMTPMQEW